MVKAGVILGIVMLILGAGGSLVTPICVPCIALIAGAGAGYLAGVYAKPGTSGGAAKAGAIAGAIGGAGALIGQILGGVINALIGDPQATLEILEQFGMDTTYYDPSIFYVSLIGGGVCLGIVDFVVMAGLGALGGILWYQVTSKNTNSI